MRGPLPALAEHGDVGVPEAVDRLKLVADEEELRRRAPHLGFPGRRWSRLCRVWRRQPGARDQVDELALEPIRVLELVDHDRAEAQLLALADRVIVPQEVARRELQVLE